MSLEMLLLLSMVGSVFTSALMWAWLRGPLIEMLRQLCDRPGTSSFWSRYALLMLIVAPLAGVVFFAPLDEGYSAEGLRRVLLVILLGHVVGFALVGRSLFKAVFKAMKEPQVQKEG